MRFKSFVMSSDTSWRALEADYRKKLASQGDWVNDEELVFGENSHAWSFAFRQDEYFVALVGLQAEQEEGGLVPVNLITNLPETR